MSRLSWWNKEWNQGVEEDIVDSPESKQAWWNHRSQEDLVDSLIELGKLLEEDELQEKRNAIFCSALMGDVSPPLLEEMEGFRSSDSYQIDDFVVKQIEPTDVSHLQSSPTPKSSAIEGSTESAQPICRSILTAEGVRVPEELPDEFPELLIEEKKTATTEMFDIDTGEIKNFQVKYECTIDRKQRLDAKKSETLLNLVENATVQKVVAAGGLRTEVGEECDLDKAQDPLPTLLRSQAVVAEKVKRTKTFGWQDSAARFELGDILLKFIPAARSGIPVMLFNIIDGASSFKARAKLVLNEGMDSVTLSPAQKSRETLRHRVELVKIQVFDYDRLKELRPQNNVVQMLSPEDHARAVLLVSKEGTTCIITEDDGMKLQMIKSLQVISARAKKHLNDQAHSVASSKACKETPLKNHPPATLLENGTNLEASPKRPRTLYSL